MRSSPCWSSVSQRCLRKERTTWAPRFSDLKDVVLRPGDVILLQTDEEGLRQLHEAEARQEAPFLSLKARELGGVHPTRMWLVAALLVGIVAAAALDWIPLMIGALGGVVLPTSAA